METRQRDAACAAHHIVNERAALDRRASSRSSMRPGWSHTTRRSAGLNEQLRSSQTTQARPMKMKKLAGPLFRFCWMRTALVICTTAVRCTVTSALHGTSARLEAGMVRLPNRDFGASTVPGWRGRRARGEGRADGSAARENAGAGRRRTRQRRGKGGAWRCGTRRARTSAGRVAGGGSHADLLRLLRAGGRVCGGEEQLRTLAEAWRLGGGVSCVGCWSALAVGRGARRRREEGGEELTAARGGALGTRSGRAAPRAGLADAAAAGRVVRPRRAPSRAPTPRQPTLLGLEIMAVYTFVRVLQY